MNLGFDVVVMVTGVVLVFAILVLLMLIITLEGKIFDAMNNKSKKVPEAPQKKAAAAPVRSAATQPAPAPVVEKGIPAEIVAVIAAAIAAMSGGKYTLRAVRRAPNNWGRAGINDTTAPF